MEQCSPSTNTSTSSSTVRSIHVTVEPQTVPIVSQPSSPRSTALPSPPDSPSHSPSDSVSSLPSVSSSFFFSSAAASPPRSNPASDHARESTQGLIIPSLTLPAPLRRPTPYGQTLGDLRLLVVGGKGSGKTYLSGSLVEDNEDIVDVGSWEDTDHGCSVLYASTDWIEHSDEHGLEKFEPSKNVEIIKVPGYEHNDDVSSPISIAGTRLLTAVLLASGGTTIDIFDDRSTVSLPCGSYRSAMLTISSIVKPPFVLVYPAVYSYHHDVIIL